MHVIFISPLRAEFYYSLIYEVYNANHVTGVCILDNVHQFL